MARDTNLTDTIWRDADDEINGSGPRVMEATPDPSGTLVTLGNPIQYVLTAAYFSSPPTNIYGFADDHGSLIFGSISPDQVKGAPIYGIYVLADNPALGPGLGLHVVLWGATLGADFFNSVTIDGTTFFTAAASGVSIGPDSVDWVWTDQYPILAAGTYAVTFN